MLDDDLRTIFLASLISADLEYSYQKKLAMLTMCNEILKENPAIGLFIDEVDFVQDIINSGLEIIESEKEE